MSVCDEYEEGRLAKQRASMTLAEWIAEVKDEVTSQWLAGNIADPVVALEVFASWYLRKTNLSLTEIFIASFFSVIEEEAKRRMQIARDDYEEQYGRRS